MPAPATPEVSLTRHMAFSSTLWAVGGALARYALAGLTTLAFTRLLTPRTFGLIALASLAQLLIEHILPVGFHDALIQHPAPDRRVLNSAFWSVLAVSGLAALIGVFLARPIAALFAQPVLAPLIVAIAGAALLRALSTVPRALLSRRLDFRALALIRLSAMLAAALIAIPAAVLGAGPWTFIVQIATFNAISTGLAYWHTGWRPGLVTDRPALAHLWRFAPSVALFTVFTTILTNADDQIVGYRLGPAALGHYALAYALMAWPVHDVLGGASAVLYPILARLQTDRPRLHTAYLESLQLGTLFAFPVLALIAVTAPVLVPWLLGARWAPIVLPAQLLALGGLREAAVMLNGAVYRALNRPQLHLLLVLASTPCYLVAFWIGAGYGIGGVALFYALAGLLLLPASWWLLFAVSDLTLPRWLAAIVPAAWGALIVAGVAGLTLHILSAPPPPVRLFSAALLSALAYAAWLGISRPPALYHLWPIARTFWQTLRQRRPPG